MARAMVMGADKNIPIEIDLSLLDLFRSGSVMSLVGEIPSNEHIKSALCIAALEAYYDKEKTDEVVRGHIADCNFCNKAIKDKRRIANINRRAFYGPR